MVTHNFIKVYVKSLMFDCRFFTITFLSKFRPFSIRFNFQKLSVQSNTLLYSFRTFLAALILRVGAPLSIKKLHLWSEKKERKWSFIINGNIIASIHCFFTIKILGCLIVLKYTRHRQATSFSKARWFIIIILFLQFR